MNSEYFPYLHRWVDPEGGIEEDVIKQMFEQRAASGQAHQVLSQLQEGVQHVFCDVFSWSLVTNTTTYLLIPLDGDTWSVLLPIDFFSVFFPNGFGINLS